MWSNNSGHVEKGRCVVSVIVEKINMKNDCSGDILYFFCAICRNAALNKNRKTKKNKNTVSTSDNHNQTIIN